MCYSHANKHKKILLPPPLYFILEDIINKLEEEVSSQDASLTRAEQTVTSLKKELEVTEGKVIQYGVRILNQIHQLFQKNNLERLYVGQVGVFEPYKRLSKNVECFFI